MGINEAIDQITILVRENDDLRAESERLQRVVDDITKKIIFACPACLTKLKTKAILDQDFEAADEYRRILQKLTEK